MIKKVPVLPIIASLIFAIMWAPPASGAPADLPPRQLPTLLDTSFSDVGSDHPFASEIRWMARSEITTGYADGTFRPENSVNRDAMAAFIFRHAGAVSEPREAPYFADVATSHPFYREIDWMAQNGYAKGWQEPDGTSSYRPALTINRDAMAAFLYRLAGSPEFAPPIASPFVDVDPTHPFYREITWLAANSITTGWQTQAGVAFKPSSEIERSAMAAFLYRYTARFQKPTGLTAPTALPKNQGLDVAWEPSMHPGVTGYMVTISQSETGPWTEVGDVGANVTTFAVNDLPEGVTYWVRYQVNSSAGLSDPSPAVPVVPTYIPAATVELQATSRSLDQGILAAGTLGNEDYYLIVAADIDVPGVGGGIAIQPSGFFPYGMFARVTGIQSNSDGTRTVSIVQAALDEVFSSAATDWDLPLTPQPDAASSASLGKAMALDTSALTCKTSNGVNVRPNDLFEASNPLPVQLKLENARGSQRFDQGNWLLGPQPFLLLQFSGELVTEISFTPLQTGFSCELSATWSRHHRLLHTVIGTIGGVPVTLDIEPGLRFSVSAEGKITMKQRRYFTYTFKMQDGNFSADKAGSADPADVDLVGELGADLFASGSVIIQIGGGLGSANAKAGVYGSFGPNLRMATSSQHVGCIDLTLSLQAEFGLQLDLWVKRWRFEFGSLTWEIGRLWGACAAPIGPGKSALVIDGSSEFGYSGGANVASQLKGAGYDVTEVQVNDYTPGDADWYSQVWVVPGSSLPAGLLEDLTAYVTHGGSLYIGGERPCCENLNGSVQDLARTATNDTDLVVGGLGDVFYEIGDLPISEPVGTRLASLPTSVQVITVAAPGGMSGVPAENVLAATSEGVPVAAAWPTLPGGGRLVIIMDVDWISSTNGQQTPQLVRNIGFFLSGLQEPPTARAAAGAVAPAAPGGSTDAGALTRAPG